MTVFFVSSRHSLCRWKDGGVSISQETVAVVTRSSCDDQFHVSTLGGSGAQLFCQTLMP